MIKLVVLLCLVSGCASLQPSNTIGVDEVVVNSQQIIWQTVRSTDWILSILLIGSVIGVFAGLNGIKSGWLATVSCIFGIFLKSAVTSIWIYYGCAIIFMGSILIGLISVLKNGKIIRELIMSNQYMKLHVDKNIAKDVFSLTQSKDTVKTVNVIKANMKSKGIIQ